MLNSLEELILSGCLNLVELPKALGKMESLRVLRVDGTAINQAQQISTKDKKELGLPSWHATFWSRILPKRFPRSTSFSLAFLPHCLVNLSLEDCKLSDIDIPEDLHCLPSLQELNLSRNPISSLPESIKRLSMLVSLTLAMCTRLRTLPELPTSLGVLFVPECWSLERIGNHHPRVSESCGNHHPRVSESCVLFGYGNDKLVEAEGFFKLEPYKSINTDILHKFGLLNVESLESIEVEMYNALTCTRRETKIQVLLFSFSSYLFIFV
jgi:Leucine-rich repeat (LRR) protein